jgi:UDP-GlcNAc:undecaprenyl-phosphate GlcNAc-1-phosphate transferase
MFTRLAEDGTFFKALLFFGSGLVIASLATPLVISIANRVGVFALQDQRRRHERRTPLLGGAAIFLSVVLAWVGCHLAGRGPLGLTPDQLLLLSWRVAPLFLIFAIGLVDDVVHLQARPKLLVQVIASGVFIFGQSGNIAALGLGPVEATALSGLILLFMLGVTNANNLIDGVDGLCGSNAILTGAGLFAIAMAFNVYPSSPFLAFVLPAFIGACLGFIPYNRKPAKIFLGDTGSLTVGFFLSASAVTIALKSQSWQGALAVSLVLAYPVIDTVLVMALRIREGRPVFEGDRSHLHHRLQRIGLSPTTTVGVLMAFSGYFSLQGAVVAFSHSLPLSMVFISGQLTLLAGALIILRKMELRRTREVVRLGEVALLGAELPEVVSFDSFLGTVSQRASGVGSERVRLLIIDHLKIVSGLIEQPPAHVAQFLAQSFERVRASVRSEDMVVRLSDHVSVILILESSATEQEARNVFDRVTVAIRDLQATQEAWATLRRRIDGIERADFVRGLRRLSRRLSVDDPGPTPTSSLVET